MDERKDAQTRFWIRNRDSLGNLVDQRLIEAANRVWERARLTVMRYLADDAEAPEILEGAVDSASRALASHQSIQFPEAYLIRSVAREAIRRYRRNQRIAYVDWAELDRLAGPIYLDLDRKLDDAKRVDVLRGCMDEHGCTMFDLRVLGFDWGHIAKLMGLRSVGLRKKGDPTRGRASVKRSRFEIRLFTSDGTVVIS
jgi:DNA-directed RNA polymerase specialized sigma24 family protein